MRTTNLSTHLSVLIILLLLLLLLLGGRTRVLGRWAAPEASAPHLTGAAVTSSEAQRRRMGVREDSAASLRPRSGPRLAEVVRIFHAELFAAPAPSAPPPSRRFSRLRRSAPEVPPDMSDLDRVCPPAPPGGWDERGDAAAAR
eukprot:5132983-Pyramimonas_sp.AAC.2